MMRPSNQQQGALEVGGLGYNHHGDGSRRVPLAQRVGAVVVVRVQELLTVA
jgi:hypothetical protein